MTGADRAKPLRLAFVSTTNASSVAGWSGIPWFMARALTRLGVSVELVGPLERIVSPAALAAGVVGRVRGRRHLFDLDPRVGRAYARQVSTRLASIDVDAILGVGAIPIAYLDTDLPLVYWADATFAALRDYYPEFTGLSDASIRGGQAMEQAAIARAGAAVFSSTWAADSARRDYAAPPERVHVIPFGANLSRPPDAQEITTLIARRPRDECRLLFLGADWSRKGGDDALALASTLNAMGIPTRLTVVGPSPKTVPASALIDNRGFIDKATPDGESQIAQFLADSHFLCLPSRAECCAIALCEASAFAVPSLACRTGGVASAVRSGVNGFLYEPGSFAQAAAATVASCMNSYEALYAPLALASYAESCSRLNWTTATQRLVELVTQLVAGAGREPQQSQSSR